MFSIPVWRTPARIRRTSVRIGTRTDSSLRFEKSLAPENARIGILRAAAMILDLCPQARVMGPLQDVGHEPQAPIEIETSAEFISQRLGTDVSPAVARGILARLGFEVAGDDEGEWRVKVPPWRATRPRARRST